MIGTRDSMSTDSPNDSDMYKIKDFPFDLKASEVQVYERAPTPIIFASFNSLTCVMCVCLFTYIL